MDGPLNRPAAVPDPGTTGPCRVSTRLTPLHDTRRARNLPLKLYLPDLPRPKGLILFSHGLGGTREGGATWLNHWASHGFAAIALQHPGSDASLLHNNSPLALRRAFKAAMNPEELAHRVEDVRVVIKHVGHDASLPDAINGAPAIGIAGHSFGAVTVQILAGERRPDQHPELPDSRIRAALALSPSARFAHTGPGLDHRFGHIHLPFLSLTGSRDDGMGLSDITAANRELPYRHMPADHGKYLLVFANGTHLDFAGQASEAEGAVFHIRRNPPLFRDNLLAASTAYWQAHLNGDSDARHWLTSDFPGRLRPDDRFEHK
jgi:predicted dienelactone hydrolase